MADRPPGHLHQQTKQSKGRIWQASCIVGSSRNLLAKKTVVLFAEATWSLVGWLADYSLFRSDTPHFHPLDTLTTDPNPCSGKSDRYSAGGCMQFTCCRRSLSSRVHATHLPQWNAAVCVFRIQNAPEPQQGEVPTMSHLLLSSKLPSPFQHHPSGLHMAEHWMCRWLPWEKGASFSEKHPQQVASPGTRRVGPFSSSHLDSWSCLNS